MPFEFTNPLVARLYRPTVEQDRMIHSGCYSGLLSNVHECAAERMVSRGSNLIKLIPGVLDTIASNTQKWILSTPAENVLQKSILERKGGQQPEYPSPPLPRRRKN